MTADWPGVVVATSDDPHRRHRRHRHRHQRDGIRQPVLQGNVPDRTV